MGGIFRNASMSSKNLIEKLCEISSRFGLPKTVVSDNGAQFISDEFQNFMKLNGIRHLRSAPYHPASNGAAENSVKTFKNALLKSVKDVKNLDSVPNKIQKFLFDYRNVEHCTTNECPAVLMFGRKLRNRFDLLQPSLIDKVSQNQEKQVIFNKGKRRDKFHIDSTVWVKDYRDRNKISWVDGIICKVLGPRSYLVSVGNGEYVWKRHLNQIYERTICDTKPLTNENNNEVIKVDRGTSRIRKSPDWYRP